MPRLKRLSPQDKLVQEKVKAERLKRQKIEADLPPKEPDYTRLEDLPPLHPDDEARLKSEFYTLADKVQTANIYKAIADYKDAMHAAIVDWQTMDRAMKGRPRNKGEDETDPYILMRDYPTMFPPTDIWAGITHNGDHPWETGRLLNSPYAQRFAEKLKEAEIL